MIFYVVFCLAFQVVFWAAFNGFLNANPDLVRPLTNSHQVRPQPSSHPRRPLTTSHLVNTSAKKPSIKTCDNQTSGQTSAK